MAQYLLLLLPSVLTGALSMLGVLLTLRQGRRHRRILTWAESFENR